jgi:hypothetical protein
MMQATLDSIAPHVILGKLLAPKTAAPKQQPVQAPPPVQSEDADKPWTREMMATREVTEVPSNPRLMSYHHQGQQLLGNKSKTSVVDEDTGVTYGLSDAADRQAAMVIAPKSEEKPIGMPFNQDSKSGERYWKDRVQKPMVTSFF